MNTCILCNGEKKEIGNYHKYKALKCSNCGLISADKFPVDEELSGIYSHGYYDNYYGGLGYETAYKKHLKKSFQRKIELINKLSLFSFSSQNRHTNEKFFASPQKEYNTRCWNLACQKRIRH